MKGLMIIDIVEYTVRIAATPFESSLAFSSATRVGDKIFLVSVMHRYTRARIR